MATNKELLKGIKYTSLYPIIFLGPAVIYNAFMNKENGITSFGNWYSCL
jgi:hypothetical protein